MLLIQMGEIFPVHKDRAGKIFPACCVGVYCDSNVILSCHQFNDLSYVHCVHIAVLVPLRDFR